MDVTVDHMMFLSEKKVQLLQNQLLHAFHINPIIVIVISNPKGAVLRLDKKQQSKVSTLNGEL